MAISRNISKEVMLNNQKDIENYTIRLRNIASVFAEKETVCKYYFIDNGLRSLQLLAAETTLMENMVAFLTRHI